MTENLRPIAVRPARPDDANGIWRVLEPIFRAGETYRLPRDIGRDAALAFWCAPENKVFVAEIDEEILGTALLRDNPVRPHGGVANAAFATASDAEGRGVGRALCEHVLARARALGYGEMQFNYVISTNTRAVRLWQRLGFDIVEVLATAFDHPTQGAVDVFVMILRLDL